MVGKYTVFLALYEDEGKITKWWPTFDNSIIIASEQKTLMHSTVNSYVSAVQILGAVQVVSVSLHALQCSARVMGS